MARALPSPALPDELHRLYDGSPSASALRVALLGGRVRAEGLARDASLRHHQRLAAEARMGAARRRAGLSAGSVTEDAWLMRLAASLAHHRHAALRRLG